MSVKLFCDRCGRECKKYWELRLHTDASCLRSDFTRVLCRSCAADVLSEVNPGAGPYGTKTTGENMDRDKLIATLKMMQVETGSLVCLGCGHEHNCGVHGCAIIREAVEALSEPPLSGSAWRTSTLSQASGYWRAAGRLFARRTPISTGISTVSNRSIGRGRTARTPLPIGCRCLSRLKRSDGNGP